MIPPTLSPHSLVTSDFAAAAVLITMGAVLGRASPFQLIIIAFFEIIFFSANATLNFAFLQAADVGGSMIIHMFGTYFGLAVSCMLYKKKAIGHHRKSSTYHSDMFAMIGEQIILHAWEVYIRIQTLCPSKQWSVTSGGTTQ